MSFSFQTKVASRGFHIYKNRTWENDYISQEILVQLETNEDSKKTGPYSYAIKTMVSGKLEAVDHIPREVSRHTYFYIKEEWGRIDGSVLSTCYRAILKKCDIYCNKYYGCINYAALHEGLQ